MNRMKRINLVVNDQPVSVEVEPRTTLLDVLRHDLGLTGAKRGCEEGDCGACSILLDGRVVNACLVLAIRLEGRTVRTIEGLGEAGRLNRLQESFVAHGALQCGYCGPGMIMSAQALLEKTPDPAEDEIRRALAGNLCRCTGYAKIVEAVRGVAREEKE